MAKFITNELLSSSRDLRASPPFIITILLAQLKFRLLFLRKRVSKRLKDDKLAALSLSLSLLWDGAFNVAADR